MAHAIERAEDYRVRHGEAVAIGCVYVAELAGPGGHAGTRRRRAAPPRVRAGRAADDARTARRSRSCTTRCASTRRPAARSCASSCSTRLGRAAGAGRARREADLRAAYDVMTGGPDDGRPDEGPGAQRPEPRPARAAPARDLRHTRRTPSSPSCASTGAASSASTSRSARPTTRASCSTGSTTPPTTRYAGGAERRRLDALLAGALYDACAQLTAPLVEVHLSRPAAAARRSSGTPRWSRRTRPRSSPGTASRATGWPSRSSPRARREGLGRRSATDGRLCGARAVGLGPIDSAAVARAPTTSPGATSPI